MTSTDLPTHGPVISGGRERYRIGDLVQLNCTSPVTVPPPKLTWYIAGERVSVQCINSPGISRESGRVQSPYIHKFTRYIEGEWTSVPKYTWYIEEGSMVWVCQSLPNSPNSPCLSRESGWVKPYTHFGGVYANTYTNTMHVKRKRVIVPPNVLWCTLGPDKLSW